MSSPYSDKHVNVHPKKLDERTLLAIGRLIRALAEVEDLVNLFICNLAEINESKMVVLLGRTPISKKVEIAEYLAKMYGPAADKLARWFFNPEFGNALRCRNAVAHGVLLGLNEDGLWSFLTAQTEPPEGKSSIQVVASYRTEVIEDTARAVEEAIPEIEKTLKLQPLRQARYGRPLSPHRKALRQQTQGGGQKRPPRSSRGKGKSH